jgi:uncharacterized membrane protein YfcA
MLFVGCVLIYIGGRMLYELFRTGGRDKDKIKAMEEKFKRRVEQMRREKKGRLAVGLSEEAVVRTTSASIGRVVYEFYGETYQFETWVLLLLTFAVGIVGGTYGVGGGAMIAPFLITFYSLPVYTIAGSTLMGAFLTSVFGIIFYMIIARTYTYTGLAIMPDWPLGILFGIGGILGTYCGARSQKFIPSKIIRLILGMLITFLALKYILQYFRG